MRRLILIGILLFSVLLLDLHADEKGSDLKNEKVGLVTQDTLRTVVKIITPPDKEGGPYTGTGFLVSKEIVTDGHPSYSIFLVTNKHMIGDWNIADGDISNYYDSINVFFYTFDSSGFSYKQTPINLKDNSGKLKAYKVMIHPNPKVDVAIVWIDSRSEKEIYPAAYDLRQLISFDNILSLKTGIGDQVFALGYPLGITDTKTNYPIAKVGYLASLPGEELIIDTSATNRKKEIVKVRLEGRLLLIDGLIVGGNSGGPVIFPYGIKMRVNPQSGQFQYLTKPIENYAMGIVSSTLGPSGLSIAFSSDYISELIDLYMKEVGNKILVQ